MDDKIIITQVSQEIAINFPPLFDHTVLTIWKSAEDLKQPLYLTYDRIGQSSDA